ncbi:murein transglycosylase A, partial [Pigmentiphaga soli]|uniref:murein transglycosylase A n=1 Tax=Pigmentiphaga soli TaxID=1007095 RepID=UPI0031EA18FA
QPAPAAPEPQPPGPAAAGAPPPVRIWPAPVSRPAGYRATDLGKLYIRSSWRSLPGWRDDDLEGAWRGFVENCRAILLRTGRPAATAAPPTVDAYAWQKVCTATRDLPAPTAAQARAFFEQWLEPWAVRGAGAEQASSIATGYYEPLVHASRVRGGAYQWPLYAVPPDLLTIDLGSLYPELAGKRVRGKLDGRRVVPYDTRADIDRPERQPPAIVWVDDPVDAFFLQVQGTGRASIDSGPGQGAVIRLAYADHNGRPYVSIGKWLVDKGELPLSEASMQGIKTWARRNPGRVKEMLDANPAVVFFREEPIADPGEGPRGAFGLPLTARRSIAVDPAVVPLGSPAFLATTQPGGRQAMDRLVLAQDTGTAIKGPARADFFFGYGEQAGEQAGRMKQPSRMWVLWPKGEGAPAAAR